MPTQPGEKAYEEVLRRLDQLELKKGGSVAAEGLEFDLKNRKAKLTGNDIYTILTFVIVVALAAVTYLHYDDSKIGRAEFIAAMKETSAAARSSAQVQREQNCLLRFPPEERQKWSDFCRQEAQR